MLLYKWLNHSAIPYLCVTKCTPLALLESPEEIVYDLGELGPLSVCVLLNG